MATESDFVLTRDLIVQGLVGLFILLWAAKDALPTYRAMKAASKASPANAMVAAVSMAWDRDQQERLLQIMERIAAASEKQAHNQANMSGTWSEMADQQRRDMHERIESLLKALERKEDQLSAMIAQPPRRR